MSRFVTKETIQDYISSDQLLEKFGGTDTWEFDYVVEKERIKNLALSADCTRVKAEVTNNDELFPEDTIEDKSESFPGEQSVQQGGRQVRFSGGLPPTRQSRFGHDDEVVKTRPISPQQQVLQAGSATSHGFRRRQVSRLMSLQETKDHKSKVEHSKSLMDEDEEEYSSVTRSLPSQQSHMVDPSPDDSVATIGVVMLRYTL